MGADLFTFADIGDGGLNAVETSNVVADIEIFERSEGGKVFRRMLEAKMEICREEIENLYSRTASTPDTSALQINVGQIDVLKTLAREPGFGLTAVLLHEEEGRGGE